MEPTEIKVILEQQLTLEEIYVTGDGSHFNIIAVGEMFDGLSRLKREQAINSPLFDYIRTNAIHALSIKALTPTEWARDKKLMQPL